LAQELTPSPSHRIDTYPQKRGDADIISTAGLDGFEPGV